ncbi:MAG: DUF933 domain-containing protein [Deltaproteobacteria bacterium]|jgi:GTP-binding protein YchF|nr:DUF933 domain-containing protein [Deltaproteobacteria bacterium]
MKAGLIGLNGSGRETIFQALIGPVPLASPDYRLGEALVPDPRLDYLSDLFKPKKTTPARLELSLPKATAKTASEGLKWALEKSRDRDVLLAVVRNFPDLTGAAAEPAKEAQTLESELILADYLTVEKRLERLKEDGKKGRKTDPEELALLTEGLKLLEDNQPLRVSPGLGTNPKTKGFGFLSAKPLLTLYNSPDDLTELMTPNDGPLLFRGRLEAELNQLDPEEAKEFMGDYGLTELGQARIIRTLYAMMDLISFFTVGEDECRAWTLKRGDNALAAAGEIHSDIQKGFIRAEVVSYEDFKAAGGFPEAKKRGVFRLEGKTYVVKDGDIAHFRFNV